MMEFLQADNLAACAGIRHGFFTRNGGVSEGGLATLNCGPGSADNPEAVAENRRRVAEDLGVEADQLLSLYQVHSPNVLTVEAPWPLSDRPKADAMVTKQKGLALGILTADCVPVLFADPAAGVIGAAHAGWRGAVGGVLENTVAAMESLGATKGSIVAAIGACIWQDSYEVGPEFPKPFLAENPANEAFFKPSTGEAGHFMFDLPGYVLAKLQAMGLASVAPSLADTCADEARFYSYRRGCLKLEEEYGRLISAIALQS